MLSNFLTCCRLPLSPRLKEDLDSTTSHLLYLSLGNFVCRQVRILPAVVQKQQRLGAFTVSLLTVCRLSSTCCWQAGPVPASSTGRCSAGRTAGHSSVPCRAFCLAATSGICTGAESRRRAAHCHRYVLFNDSRTHGSAPVYQT